MRALLRSACVGMLAVCAGAMASDMRHTAADFVAIPLQSQITDVQPMTGIVLWSTNSRAQAFGRDVQLEFSYLTYNQVVGRDGRYDWMAVDSMLAAAAARGHQMILRFNDTYPGRTTVSIPDSVVSSPGYRLNYANVEGSRTFIPDWGSSALQEFMFAFFDRFAERYDHDPRLAFVQVGFGSYAEYHLYDGPLELGRTFPAKAFQQEFLRYLDATFAQTHWSLSIDAASSTYSPFTASAALRALEFGLFDDSFMHEEHSQSDREYNRASWLFFGNERYRHSPAGGEFNYYTDYDQAHVLDLPGGAHGRSFEDFARQYRITYMIGNDQPDHQPRARIRQAAMATGYAFRITSLASNQDTVRITVSNEGIAPIYYDAWPAVDGRRATQSLRGLLPGESRAFEIAIGRHQRDALAVSIESDRLVPGQRIQFNAALR